LSPVEWGLSSLPSILQDFPDGFSILIHAPHAKFRY
jgi:hypothetical protein